MSAETIREALDRTILLVQRDFFPDLNAQQILAGLTGMNVAIVGDEENLRISAAQTFVVTTAIALAQSGVRVTLNLPDLPVLGKQPPLTSDRGLKTALQDHLRRLPTYLAATTESADMVVLVGRSPAPQNAGGVIVRAAGDSWSAVVRAGDDPSDGWTGEHPFGAGLAAVCVAADAFRLMLARLATTYAVAPPNSFSLQVAPCTRVGVSPAPKAASGTFAVDVVSSGAITTSALMTLARVPDLGLRLRVFDDDMVALSNYNRYPLLSLDQLDLAKPVALREVLADLIDIDPILTRFADDTADHHGPLADRALVGADSIPARWIAQRHSPGWLCVAATSHFEVVISEHVPEGPCAGCMHPTDAPDDGDIPTVAFASLLAGVLQAHRLVSHLAGCPPSPPVIAWALALDLPRGILPLPQPALTDCPVRCATSDSLRSRPAEASHETGSG